MLTTLLQVENSFTSLYITIYFLIPSKPIYDATLREPTAYEIERAEFLKARMKATGWWDNPFAFWRSGSKAED